MKAKIKILSSAPGYNLAAKEYDKKEKYLNSFEKGQLVPILGDVRGKKILDVGAGTGRVSVGLSQLGAEVTALDLSKEMLEVLSKKDKKIKTIVGEAESIPFKDGIFDLVLATFLIVHFKNPKTFLNEAYRVLSDGGKIVLTNINQKEPPEIETKEGMIKIESYYHRPEKIKEILSELAFEIEKEIIIKEGENWVNQILVAKK